MISNRPDARGLEVAQQRRLPAVCIASKGLDRNIYDAMLVDELKRHSVDMVCLAGFMRLLIYVASGVRGNTPDEELDHLKKLVAESLLLLRLSSIETATKAVPWQT